MLPDTLQDVSRWTGIFAETEVEVITQDKFN